MINLSLYALALIFSSNPFLRLCCVSDENPGVIGIIPNFDRPDAPYSYLCSRKKLLAEYFRGLVKHLARDI